MPEGVLDQRAADLEDPLLVAEAGGASVHLVLDPVPGALGHRVELLDEELRRSASGRPARARRAGGRRRGGRGRGARRRASSAARPARACERGTPASSASSRSSSIRSSRWPAEREERGAELVRRVRDELPARVLEAGEALAHAVERARELAELVGARVHDRLVELPARDPLGRLLEAADAPREEARASVAEERGRQRARTAPRSAGVA